MAPKQKEVKKNIDIIEQRPIPSHCFFMPLNWQMKTDCSQKKLHIFGIWNTS